MKKLSLAFVALALSAGSAMAGTVTYTASPFTNVTTDFDVFSVLQMWNPTLFPGETLLSAQITVSVSENPGTFTITNGAAGAERFIFTLNSSIGDDGGVVAADLPGVGSLGTLALFGPSTIHLAGVGGTTCIGPADPGTGTPCSVFSDNPGPIGTGNVAGALDTNAANLLLYTGSGTFSVEDFSLSGQSFSGGGNNNALVVTNVGTVTASITYTYQDSGAPEPATLTLMGSALLGLGLIGRKRFAR